MKFQKRISYNTSAVNNERDMNELRNQLNKIRTMVYYASFPYQSTKNENNIEAHGSTICQVGFIHMISPANATAIFWMMSVNT